MTARTIGGTSGETKCIYCQECRQKTLHASDLAFTQACGVGLGLSVVTCGLALPFVALALWRHPRNAYVCNHCGTKNATGT